MLHAKQGGEKACISNWSMAIWKPIQATSLVPRLQPSPTLGEGLPVALSQELLGAMPLKFLKAPLSN